MTSPSGIRLLTLPGKPSKARIEMPRPHAKTNSRALLRRGLVAGCLALVISGASGCTITSNAYKQLHQHEALGDFMISHRNRVMAARAWYRQKHCFGGHHHMDELKAGFIEGYIAVAEGGNGCVPAIAPREYWGWRYQSANGQRAVNAWFAGYPLGAKAAEQAGIGHWSQIRPAGMVPPAGDGGLAKPGAVEMVPTPFVEEDSTLPAPPDPDAIRGGAEATQSFELDDDAASGDAATDEANHTGTATEVYSSLGTASQPAAEDTAGVSANISDESDELAAPEQAEMDSEFIEIFGQPARAASAPRSEPDGKLPFTFD